MAITEAEALEIIEYVLRLGERSGEPALINAFDGTCPIEVMGDSLEYSARLLEIEKRWSEIVGDRREFDDKAIGEFETVEDMARSMAAHS